MHTVPELYRSMSCWLRRYWFRRCWFRRYWFHRCWFRSCWYRRCFVFRRWHRWCNVKSIAFAIFYLWWQSQIQDFPKEGAPFVPSAKSTQFSGGGGSNRFPWSPRADVIQWGGGG